MTAPRSSFSLGPKPQDPEERCFCFSSFLDAEQLDGLHSHQGNRSPHWEWVPTLFGQIWSHSPMQPHKVCQSTPSGVPSKAPTQRVCKPTPSCRASCGKFWPLSPLCLSRGGSPQLQIPDQSQWHLTETHCLSQTPWYPCQLCLHWCPLSSFCCGFWCSQRPPLTPHHWGPWSLWLDWEGVSELRPGCLRLLLVPGQVLLSSWGWADEKMHSLLSLVPMVLAWAFLPCQSLSAPSGEQSHF